MQEVIRDYRRLRSMVPLGTLRTKKDYARAVAMPDEIIDEIGENEGHPLAELADAIGVFVEMYEAEHVRVPTASPAGRSSGLPNASAFRPPYSFSDSPEPSADNAG